MKIRLQKIFIRVHFVVLILAVINSLFKNFSTYSLAGNIEFGIEILTAISGLILFFFYLKPFKKINFYFSIYAIVAFFLIIGLISRSLFLSLVLSVLLFPLIPDNTKYEEEKIVISKPFQGFMSRCCIYQIKERQLLIFEKDYGLWESEEGPIDFETVKINSNDAEIEITYSTNSDKGVIKKKKIKKYDN